MRVRVFSRVSVSSAEIRPSAGATMRVSGENIPGPASLTVHAGDVRMTRDKIICEARELEIEGVGGPVQITPKGERPRQFEGRVRVAARRDRLLFVNDVPVEAYVAAVMAPESADLYEPEALRAMSVVIRSYTTAERGRHAEDGADFCDLTHCQVYKGCLNLSDSWRIIAGSTHGEVLLWKGRPLIAYYHASCGGQTESGKYAWSTGGPSYLSSVSDETSAKGKAYCQKNPQYRWTSRVSAADMKKAALRAGWINRAEEISAIRITRRTPTGRARRVAITAGQRTIAVSGSVFVRRVGQALGWNKLKSTWFDVEPKEKSFLFRGKGFGHGVGFCQSGADGMARAGFAHGKILRHYFPGAEIAGSE